MSGSILTLKRAKRIHHKENPGLPFKEWVRQTHEAGNLLFCDDSTHPVGHSGVEPSLEKILKKKPLGTKPSEEYKRKPKKVTPRSKRSASDEALSEWLADRFLPTEEEELSCEEIAEICVDHMCDRCYTPIK